jgi:hypothetical protein
VNPILQCGAVPVFVDVSLPTYNIDVSRIEAAITPRTKAIMLAHTLGNPFDLDAVMAIVQRHNLWLVEDCCDALGSTYRGRKVGTFGHLGTLSFYPAHHITMGEGGAVFTEDPRLKRIAESFRDWGRDCFCDPGKDNSCGKRYGWKLGDLPEGYDHKYTYSHIGYNLKITDMQAACGVAQLARADAFIERRKRNFRFLMERVNLSCAKLFQVQPDGQMWIRSKKAFLGDCPAMFDTWKLHPLRDFKCDLGDIIAAEWPAETMKRMEVDYDTLLAAGHGDAHGNAHGHAHRVAVAHRLHLAVVACDGAVRHCVGGRGADCDVPAWLDRVPRRLRQLRHALAGDDWPSAAD